MAHYRAAIAFQCDTDFPRDVVTINPHYSGDNPQALGDSLKAAILAAAGITPGTPFTIKIYDDEKAPPSYPLYTTSNPGTAHVNTIPREVALCLSYYSGFNRPSLRGRLYIPQILFGGTAGLKPTVGQQNAVLALKDVFKAPGTSGHQWVVWSKRNKLASIVTNVWVDDEWDTVRSRGLRPTTRVTAAA
jgi:hypothetical protein